MRNPFLGTVALGIPWVEQPCVRTIASDGRRLHYNPDFVRTSPSLLVEGHLFHAILHWAVGHPWRGRGRDARRWQSAADLALVPLFLRSGYDYREVLPLKAAVGLARNRSAEEIYSILPPAEEEPPEGVLPREVAECWQEPAGETAEGNDLLARWRERLVRAAQSMAYTGSDRRAAEEILAALGRPRLDWRAELVRFLRRTHAQDFSWVPPNRRYLSRNLVLPSARTRSVGRLAVAVDTSGSIDPDSARSFLAEVQAIADLAGGSGRILLLAADDEVRTATELRAGIAVPLEFRGRGGTDFRPAFEYATRAGSGATTGLVYLTDGQGTFPERPPPFPVLWVMPTPIAVPFGEVVAMPSL